MALIPIITATTAAVSGESTNFTTTQRGFWLHCSGFGGIADNYTVEKATVQRIGRPGGSYEDATNDSGTISVGARPNSVYVDLPAGTYQINKTPTKAAASVSYEMES